MFGDSILDYAQTFQTVYFKNTDGNIFAVGKNRSIAGMMQEEGFPVEFIIHIETSHNWWAVVSTKLHPLAAPELMVYRRIREAFDISGFCDDCGTELCHVGASEGEGFKRCEACQDIVEKREAHERSEQRNYNRH